MTWSDDGWNPRHDASPAAGRPDRAVDGVAKVLAVMASIGAGLSVLAWVVDSSKRVDCTNGAVEFFPIQTIGLVASVVLLVIVLAGVVAVIWWKSEGPIVAWVVIGVALAIGLASLGLIAAAVGFHHPDVSGCWNF